MSLVVYAFTDYLVVRKGGQKSPSGLGVGSLILDGDNHVCDSRTHLGMAYDKVNGRRAVFGDKDPLLVHDGDLDVAKGSSPVHGAAVARVGLIMSAMMMWPRYSPSTATCRTVPTSLQSW